MIRIRVIVFSLSSSYGKIGFLPSGVSLAHSSADPIVGQDHAGRAIPRGKLSDRPGNGENLSAACRSFVGSWQVIDTASPLVDSPSPGQHKIDKRQTAYERLFPKAGRYFFVPQPGLVQELANIGVLPRSGYRQFSGNDYNN